MADNKCAACGQWAGKGHRCPTPVTPTPPTPASIYPTGYTSQAEAESAPPEVVLERVTRARQALIAHRAETEAIRKREEELRALERNVQHEAAVWSAVASKTIISSETLPDGTVHNTFANGTEEWRDQDGELHNDNGPAHLYSNGSDGGNEYSSTTYYKHGKKHRADGPAEVITNGSIHMESWYLDGEMHRDGGPAEIVISNNGRVETWYRNGVLHRVDGPAESNTGGYEGWYRNGVLHRVDGPARFGPFNPPEYWVNGVQQPDPNENKTSTSEDGEESGIRKLLRMFS